MCWGCRVTEVSDKMRLKYLHLKDLDVWYLYLNTRKSTGTGLLFSLLPFVSQKHGMTQSQAQLYPCC